MNNRDEQVKKDSSIDTFSLTVNGIKHTIRVNGNETLLTVLREKLNLKGAKKGCDTGECGACTVVVGKRAVRSCRYLIRAVGKEPVTTIEGLQRNDGSLHPLQRAFIDTGAVQCGFCTPGMIMAAYALLQISPNPTKAEIRQALQGNICRCTGYQPIEEAVIRAGQQINSTLSDNPVPSNVSVRPYWEVDGIRKTTGEATYSNDFQIQGTLHGAVVWTPISNGYLRNLDIADAVRVSGVIRILTASDIPGENSLGRWRHDRPLLVADRIRFAGDAIALVIAENPLSARLAAQYVKVDVTEEAGVYSPETAQNPESPKVHDSGNIASQIVIKKLNQDGRKNVSTTHTHTFATQFVEHALLEPEVAQAYYEDDTLFVVAPSQNVFFDRLEIMRVLGIPPRKMHQVRIREIYTGAAFGKREDIIAPPLAALGTFITGKPVKVLLSRSESFLATTKRHPMRITHTTGICDDNTIAHQTIDILADTGAYSSWSPNILRKSAVHASGPYFVPEAHVKGLSVYTNNAFSGAMRGFGAVQTHLAAERHLDRIAREKGLDPVQFRRINALHSGSKTLTGQTIQHITDLSHLLETAASALPWKGPALGKMTYGNLSTGYGIAASFYGIGYGNGIPDKGQVELIYKPDNTLTILTSAIDYGQGAKAVFAQLAAETLHLRLDQIDVITGDTFLTPDSGSTVASRQTFVTGNAVLSACRKLLTRLKDEYVLTEDISVKARYLLDSQKLDPQCGQGDVYQTFAVSAASARVEVDRSTGNVSVKKVVSVHDSGVIINPVAARSQVTGGVMMAAGMALWECYDLHQGIPQSLNFSDYGTPRFQDMPDIEVIFLPTSDPAGPHGAKGLGEPAMIAAVPAIVNAVCDALDIDFEATPLTKDMILKALET